MGSDLEIRVLGDLQVLRAGETLVLPPSRKTRALLAYLAVVQRPQRRERLCEMFWDVPDDPRGALRWSLSRIRSLLREDDGDLFAADRNTVGIAEGAVRTDLAEVRTLLAADPIVETLQAAADAFRGVFLDDLSLPRCPEFESWRVAHVNELELLRIDVLRRLVAALEGMPDRALPYAHQLLRLVPEDPGLPKLVSALAAAARQQSIPRPAAMEAVEPVEPAQAAAAAGQDIRFCTTADGVRIAYSRQGEGPPLIRAAHWMSHLKYDAESPIWRHWIEALSEGHTLLRYDERANGLSQWDVDDVGFEALVADLESIVDASGFRRVVLLGISQSCAISVAYAVRHPERVLGLILYGGYTKGWRARGNPTELAFRQALGTLMKDGWGSDDPVFRQLFTSLFVPGATREQMDWFNELQKRSVSPENAFRLAESFADIDVTALLPQVSVPTLVIHARNDRVSPVEYGKAFAAGIRQARFVELDSGNHVLLADEPAFGEFVKEVRRFVAEVSAPEAPRLADAEKRPVTVLAADFISPLQAFDALDPEIAVAALEPAIEVARTAVEKFHGQVVDAQDGGLTAVFGATVALEEHTAQACRAARAIADAVTRTSRGSVRVRIGIDCGEAIIRERGEPGRVAVSGPLVKAAVRLAGSLKRDIVALSGRARTAAGGFVSTTRLARYDCPGLARDEGAFELIAENKALSRWSLRSSQGLTPLVGRDVEVAALSTAWLNAREGHGAAVGIAGDPGLGKSRIAHEFIGSEALRGYSVVEAGADEVDGSAPFSLLRRVVLSLFGLDATDEGQAIAGGVQRRFLAAGLPAQALTPILDVLDQPVDDPDWASATAADRARRIREAFVGVALKLAVANPQAILIEDLHWADEHSCRALEELVNRLERSRTLLVLTYRPGFHPPWAGSPQVSEIRLSPLSGAECATFVDSLLGHDPSVAGVKALICERADGVPLFIEEIVSSLLQSRRLVGRTGAMRLLVPTDRLDVPASVQSVIAARVGRLGAADRELLQTAAVIGAAAPARLLEDLSGLGKRFEAAVGRLTEAELLFRTRASAEDGYVFKHALIHDATYASLTADRRKDLHRKVLAALSRAAPSGAAEQVERLAHHALKAEEWDAAARHLLAAADRAIERSAYPAAEEFLEQAIDALQRTDETSERLAIGLDVRTRLRIAYMVTGNFEKAIQRLTEAQAIARRMGDPTRLANTLLHTSYVFSTYGRVEQALAVADEAKAIAALTGDERQRAEADVAAAQAHMIRAGAAAALQRLLPHVEGFTGRWADDRAGFLVTRSVWFLGSIGSARALLGDIDGAQSDIAEATRAAIVSGRPIDRYAVAYFEALAMIVAVPDERYLKRLAAIAAECRDRAPFPFHPWLVAVLGHAQLAAGKPQEALQSLEVAFAAAEQANMPHFMLYASAMTAVAGARLGLAHAAEDLHDALRSARESQDRWIEYEVASALAGLHGEADAERYGRLARQIAGDAGFRDLAARAAAR